MNKRHRMIAGCATLVYIAINMIGCNAVAKDLCVKRMSDWRGSVQDVGEYEDKVAADSHLLSASHADITEVRKIIRKTDSDILSVEMSLMDNHLYLGLAHIDECISEDMYEEESARLVGIKEKFGELKKSIEKLEEAESR